MKRGVKGIIFLYLILVLSISFVSAGWFSDFWNKLNEKRIVSLSPTDVVGADGLVSYYNFDAYVRNTWLYDLIANHDATCVSGKCPVPFTSGWRGIIDNQGTLATVGNAADFDGVDDYLDYGNNSFNNYGNGTIAFWVKTDSDNKQSQTVFIASNLASSAEYLKVTINDAWTSYHGILIDSRSSNGWNWLMYTDPALVINWTQQFTHVAIVQDGISPKLYINGERVPEGSMGVKFGSSPDKTAWFDDVAGTTISYFSGKFARKGDTGSNFFKGKLDEMRIYNVALDANTISNLAGGTKCWWPPNETTQYDASITTGGAEDSQLLVIGSNPVEKSLLCYKKHWYTPDATRRNGDWADIKDYIILNKTANEKIGVWTATPADNVQQFSPYWNLTANCLWPPNAANPDGYANNNQLLYVTKIGGQAVTPYTEKSLLCSGGKWYTPDTVRRSGDWKDVIPLPEVSVIGAKLGSWTAMASDTDITPPQYSPYWKIVDTTPTFVCSRIVQCAQLTQSQCLSVFTLTNANPYMCFLQGNTCAGAGLCWKISDVNVCSELENNHLGCQVIAPQTNCTDSDNGKDYYTHGTVTINTSIGGVEITPDSCSATTGTLTEYYCNADGSLGTVEFHCPTGCESGACIAGGLEGYCESFTATGKTLKAGTRISNTTGLYYCDAETLTYMKVKTLDTACTNDFECNSNSCLDNKCTSIRTALANQAGFLTRIWCGLTNPISLFQRNGADQHAGNNGYLSCIGAHSFASVNEGEAKIVSGRNVSINSIGATGPNIYIVKLSIGGTLTNTLSAGESQSIGGIYVRIRNITYSATGTNSVDFSLGSSTCTAQGNNICGPGDNKKQYCTNEFCV